LATPVSAAAALIAFDAVSLDYGARAVLRGLGFEVRRGEFVFLTGASGAGKSSVLGLIAALQLPGSGRVTVAGADIGRLKPPARALLRQSLGLVPQDLQLLDDRSVLANVMLPVQIAGEPRARERAQAALQRVGLAELDAARLRPRALSGGEQQRVALARAIVNQPALVLADEPAAHLDAAAAAGLMALLAQFVAAGVTVIVASHDSAPLPTGARRIALRDGQVAG
jgi:cell division transport system ATP-binding protein